MCIIAAKLPDAKHPSTDEIKEMWTRNRDGAGIAYPDVNGGVTIIKGLMTLEAFMEAAAPLLAVENIFYLMHFRIATHGSTGPDMTHPFWIKENKVALAHNGILPFYKVQDDNDVRSDTCGFVEEILSKLPENWYTSAAWRHVVEEYMGWQNKLAVLDTTGIALLNPTAWTKDSSTGMIYSNGTYKVYKTQNNGGNQAANFRQGRKAASTSTTSGGNETTAAANKANADSERSKRVLDLGKRCGALVSGGKLLVHEAQKIMAEVKAGDWMTAEGEEFVDFYMHAAALSCNATPNLLWALDILGISGYSDMARVPDVLMDGKVAELLEEMDEIQSSADPTQSASVAALLRACIASNVDLFKTATPRHALEPITLWDAESAGIFLGKPVRIKLIDGQRRIGHCFAVGKAGMSYSRHDGGSGTCAWTYIDTIETRLVLQHPTLQDLQRHIGCLVSVNTVTPSHGFSGQLTTVNSDSLIVKSDMGIIVTAKYDEILSVTIDEDPPVFKQQKA